MVLKGGARRAGAKAKRPAVRGTAKWAAGRKATQQSKRQQAQARKRGLSSSVTVKVVGAKGKGGAKGRGGRAGGRGGGRGRGRGRAKARGGRIKVMLRR